MVIVITNKKNRDCFFANEYTKISIIENFCNLEKYKEEDNTIIFHNIFLDKSGILKEFNYYLEELFITLKINLVICNKKSKKLEEICSYYRVPLIFT